MDHPAFLLKSHSALWDFYIHSLLAAYLSKNCQHAVLPEIVVRCIMYQRSAFAHFCSYTCYSNSSSLWVCYPCVTQGQQKSEAHECLSQPLRKSRQPWCEILHVWCFLVKHIYISVSWTLILEIFTDFLFTDLCNFHSQSPNAACARAHSLAEVLRGNQFT